jgi:hypothetical protein
MQKSARRTLSLQWNIYHHRAMAFSVGFISGELKYKLSVWVKSLQPNRPI